MSSPRRASPAVVRYVALLLLLLLLFAVSGVIVDGKKGHPKKHGDGRNGQRNVTLYIDITRHTQPLHHTPVASQATPLTAFASSHDILSSLLATSTSGWSSPPSSAPRSPVRSLLVDAHQIRSLRGNSSMADESDVISLTDSYHVMYTARVSIGTPPQLFNMILDTGSSCLWAISASPPPPSLNTPHQRSSIEPPSSSSSSTLATPHSRYLHYYDHSLSSTYEPVNTPWDIQYGVGQCTGFLSRDRVALSPVLVSLNQTIAEAVSLSSNFLNPSQPLDGIVGMSFQGGACRGYNTLLESLYDNGVIGRRVFSFHLDRREGEGEVNQVVIGEDEGAGLNGERIVYTDVLHAPHRPPAMWFVHLEAMGIVFPHSSSPVRRRNSSKREDDDGSDQTDHGSPAHSRERGKRSERPEDDDVDMADQDQDVLRTQEQRDASRRLREFIARHHEEAGMSSVATDTLTFCGPNTGPCIALPDTGTSFLTLPTRLFILVISIITHDRDDCIIDSLSNVFCLAAPHTLPSIAFQFASRSFVLSPADYMLPNHQLAIQVLDFGVQDVNIVILGDVFLRKVRVVFDEEDWRVGFVQTPGQEQAEGDQGKGDDSWLDMERKDAVIRVGLVGLLVLAALLLCFALLCCYVCWDWCVRRRRYDDYQPIASVA